MHSNLSYPCSPISLALSIWKNHQLITQMIRRDVTGHYKGSMLGLLWSFFTPLLMLCVYTFVFSVVFETRWSTRSDSKSEFALVLFSGMIIFNFFAECINRAPSLIIHNTPYVKKIVFPLEILVIVALGGAFCRAVISLFVWIGAYLLIYGIPCWPALFLPIVLLPLILITAGVSWGLSSLGVYLRDISEFIKIITTILLIMSPIFYPVGALPEKYRFWTLINPLAIVIEQTRDVLIWRKYPNFMLLSIAIICSGLVAWGGFIWFQKTRRGFADVL